MSWRWPRKMTRALREAERVRRMMKRLGAAPPPRKFSIDMVVEQAVLDSDVYKRAAADIREKMERNMTKPWDENRYRKGPAVKIIEFRLPSKRLPQEVTKCGVKEEALFRAFNEAFGVTPEKLCALGRQTRYGNITVRCTADQFAAFVLLRARYGAENWIAELDANYLDAVHAKPSVMLDVSEPHKAVWVDHLPTGASSKGPDAVRHGTTEHKFIDGYGNAWIMNDHYVYRNGRDIRHLSHETLWSEVVQKIGFAPPEYAGTNPKVDPAVDGLAELIPGLREAARKFAAQFDGPTSTTGLSDFIRNQTINAFMTGALKYGRPMHWSVGNPDNEDDWMRPFFAKGLTEDGNTNFAALIREMAHAIQPGGMFSSAGLVDWKRRAEEALGRVPTWDDARFRQAVLHEVDLRLGDMTKDVRKDTLREVMDLIRTKYKAARADLQGHKLMRHNQLTMRKITFLQSVGRFFLANFYSEAETKAWQRETREY